MKRALPLPLAAAVILLAAPVLAVPGGQIDTLPLGHYVCELPGDATGAAGRPVPDADFTVINASSYTAQGMPGIYLLTGDRVTMTAGPMKGQRYRRISANFIRKLDGAGRDTEMRCVRQTANNR